MKLYHMRGACSLADLIVLEWVDIPYDVVRVTRDTLQTPEYLARNPGGTVPLLEDGDFRISENVAILEYLADLHPEARLLGDGSARGRAQVMRWLAFLNSDVHGAFKPLFTPERFIADAAFADMLASAARQRIRKYLEMLDAQLAHRDWLTAQRSVADPYLFVISRWAIRKEVPLHGLRHLARFSERMYADQGVQRAIAAGEPS